MEGSRISLGRYGLQALGLGLLIVALAHGDPGPWAWRNLRLPRVLMGWLVGANLAFAGALLQTLFGNPLASPFLVGVTGSAVLGVGLLVLLGWEWAHAGLVLWTFVCGLVGVGAVWRIAAYGGLVRKENLLLAGVLWNAAMGAVLYLLFALARPEQLFELQRWNLGSLQTLGFREVAWLAGLSVPVWWLLWRRARDWDLLLLGEEVAATSGLDVRRARRTLYWAAAWLVAAAVSFAGVLGFVGLVVPHLVRGIAGSRHEVLLPGTLWWGGLLVVAADLGTRLSGGAVPPGVWTSLLGTAAFFYLLRREW